ncbi:MAG: SpoIIE family protein phosphatase [Thermodesulforhabdaceae bacterium]
MKMLPKGLRFTLIASILSAVGFLFIVIFLCYYFYSRSIVEDLIRKNAFHLTSSTVNEIEVFLRGIEKVTTTTAIGIEAADNTFEERENLIREMVKNNPEIYGSTFAMEPSFTTSFNGGEATMLYAPYWYRSDQDIRFRYLNYDYTRSDWYLMPKELQKPCWSEPYFDEGGGECLMTTYSVPFFTNQGEKKVFSGVVTVDISLKKLQDIVESIKIGRSGYAFIISQNGTFVMHPDDQLIMNETIFTIAEARKDRALREIGRRMIRGETGYEAITDWKTDKEAWLVFMPLPSSEWSVGVIFPKDELLENITKLNWIVVFIGASGLAILCIIVVLVSNSITRPLITLCKVTDEIAQGNLEASLPAVSSGNEIALLASSFASMQESLKGYIQELSRTIAEKERIASELTIAREIQMGILPKVFPPFPDREEFDIHAVLHPAREVGGDFYDFFFTEKDRFWVAVGDVSGKGVPASLFMAVTRTLIKAKANGATSPGVVLEAVNRDLSGDNPSLLFVTIFLGMLDTRTGLFTYANGGHNSPYLTNGKEVKPRQLPTTKGLALGVHDGFKYREGTVKLEPGDIITFYTDGVTEAVNEKGEFFSTVRLESLLENFKGTSPKVIVEELLRNIKDFSGNAPQADDITIMIMKFNGF